MFDHVQVLQGTVCEGGVSQVDVALPEQLGSRQGLPFSWIEAGEPGDIDDEGADVRGLVGRRTGANHAVGHQPDVEDGDFVVRDDVVGRGVRLVARDAFEIEDVAGGDGIEGDTLSQVVGVVELSVLTSTNRSIPTVKLAIRLIPLAPVPQHVVSATSAAVSDTVAVPSVSQWFARKVPSDPAPHIWRSRM